VITLFAVLSRSICRPASGGSCDLNCSNWSISLRDCAAASAIRATPNVWPPILASIRDQAAKLSRIITIGRRNIRATTTKATGQEKRTRRNSSTRSAHSMVHSLLFGSSPAHPRQGGSLNRCGRAPSSGATSPARTLPISPTAVATPCAYRRTADARPRSPTTTHLQGRETWGYHSTPPRQRLWAPGDRLYWPRRYGRDGAATRHFPPPYFPPLALPPPPPPLKRGGGGGGGSFPPLRHLPPPGGGGVADRSFFDRRVDRYSDLHEFLVLVVFVLPKDDGNGCR
jgi:hypothetical protein